MKGWRTYASVVVGTALTLAHQAGWINDQLFTTLGSLAGLLGLGFLRAAIGNK